MPGRLEGKAAVVVGAGQTPGETIGNGRATALLLAREGARVIVVDRRLDSAEETVAMIRAEGGEALLKTDPRLAKLKPYAIDALWGAIEARRSRP